MAVFSSAPYGATAERQIQNRIFGQFCASFANYAPTWTLFSPSLTGLDFLCNALNVTQFVGRWRQKIRRFGGGNFPKGKQSDADFVPNTSYEGHPSSALI